MAGSDGLQQIFIAQGQVVSPGGVGQVHAAGPEPAAQLAQAQRPVGAGQVHLVDEHEHRHPVTLQKPPQRFGMALDAVGAADDQDGVVHHLQSALGLGGKVHMAGGVQQRQLGAGQFQHRLLGKDRDAPRPLQRVGVEKGVPMVHPPQFAQRPRAVEHRLAQGRFARIDVRRYANDQPFHPVVFPSCARAGQAR